MISFFRGSALDSVAATLAATAGGGLARPAAHADGLTAALTGISGWEPSLVLRPCRPGSQVAAARAGRFGRVAATGTALT